MLAYNPPAMTDRFSDQYADLLEGQYDCVNPIQDVLVEESLLNRCKPASPSEPKAFASAGQASFAAATSPSRIRDPAGKGGTVNA
jgi:hypothetical protein